ncbi:ABC-2 type transport system permease protein [Streptacidiphilus sp. MAP12-20]|uniref:ABC transporter permease n=1 Tax=Streptacidiphilus sp. MAP12-20 TaxID=3156299 RepID=UPI00351215EC
MTTRVHRLARIAPLAECMRGTRLATTGFVVATQVLLYAELWRALYAHTASVAGLDVRQAVTYSTLAALATTARTMRGATGESVKTRILDGSIAYWFLRPVSARRYRAWYGVGEALYSSAWVVGGLALGLGLGLVAPPASAAVAAVSAVSFGLGLVVLYCLTVLIDIAAFWTVSTDGVTRCYEFVQSLLSGALIPLWFFPGWLGGVAAGLPFAAGVSTPISLYAGRIRLADAVPALAGQAGWCLALAMVTALGWRRAGRRLVVLGG